MQSHLLINKNLLNSCKWLIAVALEISRILSARSSISSALELSSRTPLAVHMSHIGK